MMNAPPPAPTRASAQAPDRRRMSPDDRRAQIVAGAVAFFAENGLDATTRDLSRQLGVTQSLIFNYFATKADLLEAVYEQVYLDRLSPDWPGLIIDRSLPLRDRVLGFYLSYSEAIFTYEWMRIFMFSGLAGAELNRRYLGHLGGLILQPMRDEIAAEAAPDRQPGMEDIWNLHGGVVYIGIRRYVYQVDTPTDDRPVIEAAVDRFLSAYRSAPR